MKDLEPRFTSQAQLNEFTYNNQVTDNHINIRFNKFARDKKS